MMADRIERLIIEARSVTMTPQEWEAQRRSFAYGNTKLANDDVTRESIDREAEKMNARQGAHGDYL